MAACRWNRTGARLLCPEVEWPLKHTSHCYIHMRMARVCNGAEKLDRPACPTLTVSHIYGRVRAYHLNTRPQLPLEQERTVYVSVVGGNEWHVIPTLLPPPNARTDAPLHPRYLEWSTDEAASVRCGVGCIRLRQNTEQRLAVCPPPSGRYAYSPGITSRWVCAHPRGTCLSEFAAVSLAHLFTDPPCMTTLSSAASRQPAYSIVCPPWYHLPW